MMKTCSVSGKQFEITEDDLKFYEKMGVPVPTLCPEERDRRRSAFRNERKLYWRKCDGTGKRTLSIYSLEKPYKIYIPEYWYSDKWDVRDYGRDFDFSRSFFEQFFELWKEVPRLALATAGNENSEFVNYSGWSKNCYFTFDSDHNEDTLFQTHSFWNKDCVDGIYLNRSELCYECINSFNCYNCRFCQDCKNDTDSWFLKSCIGCKNCFGCVNLRNKQYYFLNKKYSKEEYEKKLNELNLHQQKQLKNMRDQFSDFIKKIPQKYYQGVLNENISGDYIDTSKKIFESFDVSNCHDGKFLIDISNAKDCYDVHAFGGSGAELCYECHVIGEKTTNVQFSSFVFENVYNIFYSESCMKGAHDLFGCTGMNHAQYCILNKQYTKEEYFELKEKIIEHMKKTGEWGEFFPIDLSPFAYNETEAQEYFPLTKEEALKRGYKWKEIPDQVRNDNGGDDNLVRNDSVDWENVSDSITEVSDDIVKEILSCQSCSKQYKIQKAELKFYRKMNLPIPRKCPDCRHTDRMKLRNPRKLWKRNCDKCSKEIQTTFAPERPETVYCEACYLKEVN